MCGIVGIYLKNEKLQNSLGSLLAKMLINMGSRGPDSAGFAIYKKEEKEKFKYSICINKLNFKDFEERINKHLEAELKKNSDHVILKTSAKPALSGPREPMLISIFDKSEPSEFFNFSFFK